MDIYYNLNESKKDKGGEIKTNKTFTLFEPTGKSNYHWTKIDSLKFRKTKPAIYRLGDIYYYPRTVFSVQQGNG